MAKRESEVRFRRGTEWVVLEGPAKEATDLVRAELEGLLAVVNGDLAKRLEDDRTRQGVAMDRALIHATTAMDYLRQGAPLAALPFAVMAAACLSMGTMSDEAYALAAERAATGRAEAPLVYAVRKATGIWRGLHPFLQTTKVDRWGTPPRDSKGNPLKIPTNVPACSHEAAPTGDLMGLVGALASRELKALAPRGPRPPRPAKQPDGPG